ncbi:MAG: SwmB domain-containing protein, partial [Rhodospirillaceae bacterium]|nr:SwmB domain-containing protein [Rhodospirillaceae bacterium]
AVTGPKGTLVGNTGQSNDGTQDFTLHVRQLFTTGSNSLGYKLTSVTVPYAGSAPAASSHDIKIFSTNTGNLIGDELATLSYGSVSGTTVTYTASDGGIDLDPRTNYFVFFDPLATPSGPKLRLTNSGNEDAGKADGWSLRDNRATWTSGEAWKFPLDAWQIAIDGAAVVSAPQPQSASVAGTKLKIVFDKALDDTATESGENFTVVFSDRDGEQSSIAGTQANVAISGSTVTVTLAEAVPPNATAQVTYEPPTPSLKADGDDTYVASFLGFKIETVYDTAVPELMQAAVAQTSKNPDGFRVALYYDEALDPDSVPATTDFGVKLDSNAAVTPNAVAIEDKTVLLTVDLAKEPGDQGGDVTYTEADVSYTKGTNPIRDPAGNDAASFTGLEQTGLAAKVEVEAAGTPAVAAPVPGTLVGNTGQSFDLTRGFSDDHAQAFTTGSNTQGYKLTSLRVPYVSTVAPASSHTISIHASNSNNRPGDSLGTLSYGSVSGSTVTYTGDIDLASGTTYFVVLDTTAAPNLVAIKKTGSDNEDSGAADGWSLANTGLRRLRGTDVAWLSEAASWQIAIQGIAAVTTVTVTVTVPATSEGTLVGTTGQSSDQNISLRRGSPKSGRPTAGCAPRSGAGSPRPGRWQRAAGATSCPAMCRSRGGMPRPRDRTRSAGVRRDANGTPHCGIRRPALPSPAPDRKHPPQFGRIRGTCGVRS